MENKLKVTVRIGKDELVYECVDVIVRREKDPIDGTYVSMMMAPTKTVHIRTYQYVRVPYTSVLVEALNERANGADASG